MKSVALFLTLTFSLQSVSANAYTITIHEDSSDEFMESVCNSKAQTAALGNIRDASIGMKSDDFYVEGVSILKMLPTTMAVEVYVKSVSRPKESAQSVAYFCHNCVNRTLDPIILSLEIDTDKACSPASGEVY